MLRSPAEYFLKYLASYPNFTLGNILTTAKRFGIYSIPGGEDYIQFLRDNMDFPPNFDPQNSSHEPSIRFLTEEGIYDLWYPTDSTRQAIDLYKSSNTRELVTSLLSTPMSLQKLADYLQSHHGLDVEIRALQEFKHYFWNMDLLSEEDRKLMLATPGSSEIVKTAAITYKDALGPAMLLWKMGYLPPRIPRSDMLYALRDIAFMNALEADRVLHQGRNKATAFREYFDVVAQAQAKLDDQEAKEQNVVSEFYKHITVGQISFQPKPKEELAIEEREVIDEGYNFEPDDGEQGS